MNTPHHTFYRALGTLIAAASLLTACASNTARDDLNYGRALLSAGRVREAMTVLEKAHQAAPSAQTAAALQVAKDQLTNLEKSRVTTGVLQNAYASSVANSASAVSSAQAVSASSASSRASTLSSSSSVGNATVVNPVLAAPRLSAKEKQAATKLTNANLSTPPQAPIVKRLENALDRPVTLQFRDAPVRSLFDAIGKSSGLNIVIDRDVPPDLTTSIYLKDTTVRNALEKIAQTTRLGWQATDDNTLMVYVDDLAKQNDYQNMLVRGFHLANADAKIVANSLKTVLKFKDVVVDDKLNMIVVRDTPKAMKLAEQLIALHDVPEPEVMLEVAILEVSQGKLQNLGVAWPTSATLSPLARTITGNTTSTTTNTSTVISEGAASLTVRDLYNLTPGSLLLNLAGGGATINANASDSDLNLLANPRIRAKNREKARVLIGERVPNISSTTTATGVVGQNITYVDVGLKLDVEPQIFPGNEIGLKIALEVSSINSTVENKANGSVAYRIGTRTASTYLRLKDGENQVLGGLVQDSDRKTVSKVPLLGDIPVLGRLFRSDNTDKGKTELVLSITPRLIRGIAKPNLESTTFEAGTISSIRGRRSEAEIASDQNQAQQQNGAQPQPNENPQPVVNQNRRRED